MVRWSGTDTPDNSTEAPLFAMNTPRLSQMVQIAAAVMAWATMPAMQAASAPDSVVTAVFSRSFNNYERAMRADGSPEPQTYVIAKGGYTPGVGPDESIDHVKFAGIVRVLGGYLAKQGYFPAKDPKTADVMLVVHWGKTIPGNNGLYQGLTIDGLQAFSQVMLQAKAAAVPPPSYLSMAGGVTRVQGVAELLRNQNSDEGSLVYMRFVEDMRGAANQYNANLLGYTGELQRRNNISLWAGGGTAYSDLIDDLEQDRYYLTLTAFDFQEALRHDRKKGLWRTIVSIAARDNRFDEKLAVMAAQAARYFGRDSGHLVRQFEYTPHVELGDLKALGVVDTSPAPRK